jgi:hypothetical protein
MSINREIMQRQLQLNIEFGKGLNKIIKLTELIN